MTYLLRLFELAESLLDDHDPANPTFGLAEPDADSSLARDDEETRGYWVSIIVIQAITASLDHAIALRDLVVSGKVTNAAPWTILRGVLEPAALAVWVLNGGRASIVKSVLSGSGITTTESGRNGSATSATSSWRLQSRVGTEPRRLSR